ncbi:putative quinol monooxygenase [Pseudonocardia aurantiaca]
MRAKPGKEDEVLAMLTDVIEPTLAEAGCHTYALHQGVADPTVFVFYENWTSKDHLDKHLASGHIANGLAGLSALLDGTADIQTLRRAG